MSLEDVIDNIMTRHVQASNRLDALADYTKSLFGIHGLHGVQGGSTGEISIPGLARSKEWDLAYDFAGKKRLVVSMKSIWNNPGGSVPNRIDDVIGEAANVQQLHPEIVTGYLVLFDMKVNTYSTKHRTTWCDVFELAIRKIAIRQAPLWNQGLLEGAWFIRFDSSLPHGSRVHDPARTADEGDAFVRALITELRIREPAIP